MSIQSDILARFSGQEDSPAPYLPDLTLWYEWHKQRGTLPAAWRGFSLPKVARTMGVPVWLPVRPWRQEIVGAEVSTTEQDGERVVFAETPAGTLVARWSIGPDGDWWQTEFPVKTAADLPAALELVRARTYVLDPAALPALQAEVGTSGILALEIPRRPYADLLHQFLGWSEGLMLLGEPTVLEMLDILEAKLQHLMAELAQLPGQIVLSPDNLDGQFISPRAFTRHLAAGYRRTSEVLHSQQKHLLVHVGGPVRHLLQPLAEAGVDGLQGIAGPPQSNATLAQARDTAGPNLTLWGGIPQDFLLATHDRGTLAAAVSQAVHEAGHDGRIILGVADRVPVDAELDRLQAIPRLVEEATH